MIAAVLFDLDETLIVDHPVSRHALLDCAWRAAGVHALDAEALAAAAERHANALWTAAPTWAYCERIGHSALEGLWARYESGAHPELKTLAAGAAEFRRATWRAALAAQGIADEPLGRELSARFIAARSLFPRYPEIDLLLETLAPAFKLGVVTNGVPDLQRDKLAGSGLADRFMAVAISGEVDSGKPEKQIFERVCGALGVAPADCVMVGDNPERDIAGARHAGMRSVLVDRGLRPPDTRFPADLTVKSLLEMIPWLGRV